MSGNAGVLRILVLGGFRLGDTGVVEVLCGGRGCSWLFQGCGVAYGLCPKSRATRACDLLFEIYSAAVLRGLWVLFSLEIALSGLWES